MCLCVLRMKQEEENNGGTNTTALNTLEDPASPPMLSPGRFPAYEEIKKKLKRPAFASGSQPGSSRRSTPGPPSRQSSAPHHDDGTSARRHEQEITNAGACQDEIANARSRWTTDGEVMFMYC